MTLIAAASWAQPSALSTRHFGDQSCDMGRSIELTLWRTASTIVLRRLESWLRLRFDAIPFRRRVTTHVGPGAESDREVDPAIMSPLPLKKAPLVKTERNLERLEKLIELFEPIILLNEHDFAAEQH